MSKFDTLAFERWEGAAQSFVIAIRKTHHLMITTNHHNGLSMYGVKGYKNNYKDYLERIDEAIKTMQKGRRLFVEAEFLRNEIERI